MCYDDFLKKISESYTNFVSNYGISPTKLIIVGKNMVNTYHEIISSKVICFTPLSNSKIMLPRGEIIDVILLEYPYPCNDHYIEPIDDVYYLKDERSGRLLNLGEMKSLSQKEISFCKREYSKVFLTVERDSDEGDYIKNLVARGRWLVN